MKYNSKRPLLRVLKD